MAVVTEDRILELSSSTGAGNLTLLGSPTGYRRFGSVCAIGDTFFGSIVAVDSNGVPTGQWECGYYTYSNTNTITRTKTLSSSAGGETTVSFTAGTKQIFMNFIAWNAKNAGTPFYQTQIIHWYGDARVVGLDGAFTDNRIVANPTPKVFIESIPASPPYVVVNHGVFAETTTKLLSGTDGTHQAWSTEMANSAANVIFIQLGASDQHEGLTTAQFLQNLNDLVSIAKNAGKGVVLVTPPPVGNVSLQFYADAMKQAANTANISYIDFYAYTNSLITGSTTLTTLMPDGLHPNQDTYTKLGQYAASVFGTLKLPPLIYQ